MTKEQYIQEKIKQFPHYDVADIREWELDYKLLETLQSQEVYNLALQNFNKTLGSFIRTQGKLISVTK